MHNNWKSLETTAVVIAVGLLATVTSVSFFGRWHWLLEITTHFRVQYILCSFFAAVILIWRKYYKNTAFAVACLVVNAIFVAPLYIAKNPSSYVSQTRPLRIMAYNVLSQNTQGKKVAETIVDEQADVVVLCEVTARWREDLRVLDQIYPHSKWVTRSDNFGIALLSRKPLHEVEVCYFGSAEVPTIVATLHHGRDIKLIATHPTPPRQAQYAQWRNEQLVDLAQYAARVEESVIVVGDLNTTSWSPHFADFVATSGLRDTRSGYGVQATWPAEPLLFWLWIPIDHCLVSPDIFVHDRRLAASNGSDHYPVIVDVSLTHQ